MEVSLVACASLRLPPSPGLAAFSGPQTCVAVFTGEAVWSPVAERDPNERCDLVQVCPESGVAIVNVPRVFDESSHVVRLSGAPGLASEHGLIVCRHRIQRRFSP